MAIHLNFTFLQYALGGWDKDPEMFIKSKKILHFMAKLLSFLSCFVENVGSKTMRNKNSNTCKLYYPRPL